MDKGIGPYVPMAVSLWGHPKLLDFAGRLGLDPPAAVGHIYALWREALQSAPSGTLTNYTPGRIAFAMHWPQNRADELVAALVGSGLLERGGGGELLIHDWHKGGGKQYTEKTAEAERQRNYRQRNPDYVRTVRPPPQGAEPEKVPLTDPYPLQPSMIEWVGRIEPGYPLREIEYQHQEFCSWYHSNQTITLTNWTPRWEAWMRRKIREWIDKPPAARNNGHAPPRMIVNTGTYTTYQPKPARATRPAPEPDEDI